MAELNGDVLRGSKKKWLKPLLWVMLLIVVLGVALWNLWQEDQEEAAPAIPPTPEVVDSQKAPAPAAPQEAAKPELKPEEKPVEAPQAEAKEAEREYVVREGDSLGTLFGKDAKAVCKLNKLKDCDLIQPNQKLELPKGVEPKARKAVKRLADGSLPIARLGVDPYGPHRTPEKDRKVLEGRGYTSAEIDEYLELREQGKYVREEFPRGTKFLWMAFGKKPRVLENLTAVWKKPEVGLVYVLKSGRTVVVLEKCENLAEVAPRVPKVAEVPAVKEEEAPPAPEAKAEEPEEISPFVEAKAVARCDLQAGTGVYKNEVYRGNWAYGEGLCYLNENGEWQHGPGLYAMAGKGHNTFFSHKEYGIGPQYGAQRNWINDRGNKTTLDLKARLLYDWWRGEVPATGFFAKQSGLKLGGYLGYTERVNGEGDFVGGMLEYWKGLNQKVGSSWSGQPVQDRGSTGASVFYEHKLTDDNEWRLRWIGGLQHTNWDKQDWFRFTPEFRYQNWLMFGPQLTWPVGGLSESYKGIPRGDLQTIGAFVRVELQKHIQENDADNREAQIEFIPAQEAAKPPE